MGLLCKSCLREGPCRQRPQQLGALSTNASIFTPRGAKLHLSVAVFILNFLLKYTHIWKSIQSISVQLNELPQVTPLPSQVLATHSKKWTAPPPGSPLVFTTPLLFHNGSHSHDDTTQLNHRSDLPDLTIYKNKITRFFQVWFLWFNMKGPSELYTAFRCSFPLFFNLPSYHCVVLYSFYSYRTSVQFTVWGYYKQRWCGHACTHSSVDVCMHFGWGS